MTAPSRGASPGRAAGRCRALAYTLRVAATASAPRHSAAAGTIPAFCTTGPTRRIMDEPLVATASGTAAVVDVSVEAAPPGARPQTTEQVQ
jgi:hypothetical protein